MPIVPGIRLKIPNCIKHGTREIKPNASGIGAMMGILAEKPILDKV
jgi:hypothetical protein